jgi:hypothetical protein
MLPSPTGRDALESYLGAVATAQGGDADLKAKKSPHD